MGGCNHDTWKQPPASLRAEWPTKSAFMDGPSLDDEKARMRETRTKVSSAIAASGLTVPRWPEVGQPAKWNLPTASLGDGLANLARGNAQNSSLANGIPHGHQSSSTNEEPQSFVPSEPTEETRSNIDQRDPPLLQLIRHRRNKLQQSNLRSNTRAGALAAQDDHDMRNYLDPSILNPQINVVELPDHIFHWPPPPAPRAMLEQLSSQDQQTWCGRPRRHSEATESSFDTAITRRARGYSSATNGTHNTICECGKEHGPKNIRSRGSKIDVSGLTAKRLQAADWAQAQPSVASKAELRHALDTTRVVGPPPGFESHHTTRQGITSHARSGSGAFVSESDRMSGSWSQSLNWLSDQERLKANFFRMQEKAHHLGWDKSPFLPKSVGEYASLLAERKAAEAKRILKKIEKNERAAQTRKGGEAMQIELLKCIMTNDGLSSVLAMESCFNEIPADLPESERVDWPPDAEFRIWKGSRPPPPPGFARRRSSSHRGVWPFPRINVPYRPKDSFPENDVPYSQRRVIFVPRWDWIPNFSKILADNFVVPVEEMIDVSMLLPSDLFYEPTSSS